VAQWRSVEADEQSRLADVLAGGGREQRAQLGREGRRIAQQVRLMLVVAHDDDIQVRELVHGSGSGRAAHGQAHNPRIVPGRGKRRFEEGTQAWRDQLPVRVRHGGPPATSSDVPRH
jgi:hypothetical protein